jgi:hypothetical protein
VNLSILFYLIAVICFFIAAVDWPPFSAKALPLGLMFLALGHVVSGITLKAG